MLKLQAWHATSQAIVTSWWAAKTSSLAGGLLGYLLLHSKVEVGESLAPLNHKKRWFSKSSDYINNMISYTMSHQMSYNIKVLLYYQPLYNQVLYYQTLYYTSYQKSPKCFF